MDVVSVLEQISSKQKRLDEQINIDRPLAIDLGNLTVWDGDNITIPKAGSAREKYLEKIARDDAQAIINKLCELETTMVEGLSVVKLPQGTTILPRSRHIPKPKEPTKWERFAKQKGITKNKTKDRNEKLVWDDVTDKWVPRHGYKRAQNEEQKDWLIEVPNQADPNVDYFTEKNEKKKERVARNEFQKLRNDASANKKRRIK